MPETWNISYITSIYKSGDPLDTNNYIEVLVLIAASENYSMVYCKEDSTIF